MQLFEFDPSSTIGYLPPAILPPPTGPTIPEDGGKLSFISSYRRLSSRPASEYSVVSSLNGGHGGVVCFLVGSDCGSALCVRSVYRHRDALRGPQSLTLHTRLRYSEMVSPFFIQNVYSCVVFPSASDNTRCGY